MQFAPGALQSQKVAALVALSADLLRFGRGLDIVETELRRSVAAQSDELFVAGLTLAATITAEGFDAVGIRRDLRLALQALSTDASSVIRLGMSHALAKRLSQVPTLTGEQAFPGLSPSGGVINGLPVSVTDALTVDVLAIDCRSMVGAGDEISLRESRHAAIQLSSTPTIATAAGSPPAPVAASLVSMWQTDSRAVMAERHLGFTQLRPGVVKIANASLSWGLEGSPPA